MNYFTLEELSDMVIDKMEYDPENKGWSFYVIHDEEIYYLKDFSLPDPDIVTQENLVAKIKELMLRVKNVKTKDDVRKKYEVVIEDILKTPLTNLDEEDYVRPDNENEIFEFNGIGGSNVFIDNLGQTNNIIHIIFNSKSLTWKFGKLSNDTEWAYTNRVISVNGNVIKLMVDKKLDEQLTWEYLDDYNYNKMEYNGVAGKEFFTDGINYFKFNIHVILDMKSLLWYFGPNNTEKSWIDKYGKRTVLINGYTIELGDKRNDDGYFSFSVLKEPKTESDEVVFNGLITPDMILDGRGGGAKYNINIIIYTNNMTWTYGPENVDYGFMQDGRDLLINGMEVRLTLNEDKETGFFMWNYL